MQRVAVFGKDHPVNAAALDDYIAAHLPDLQDAELNIGVQSFDEVAQDYELDTVFFPRPADTSSLTLGPSLCKRLGAMLEGVDYVIALPIGGRMTRVEIGMAMEAGIRIVNVEGR